MENISNKTLIGVGIGAIALGIAVYFLSKDDSESKLDPAKKHTLQKLKLILD